MIHLRGLGMLLALVLLFVFLALLIIGCSDPEPTAVAPQPTMELAPPVPTPRPIPPLPPAPDYVTDAEIVYAAALAVVPTPRPRPVPVRRLEPRPAGNCYSWLDLVASYFPAWEIDNACAILGCESKGDPNAISSTSDHGLFQINKRTWNKPDHPDAWQQVTGTEWSNVYDPTTNVAFAADLWGRSKWGPWSCAPKVGIQ